MIFVASQTMTRLFVRLFFIQKCVQAQNKEYIKAHNIDPL